MNWVGVVLSILWFCSLNLLKFFIVYGFSEMGIDDSSESCAQLISGHQFLGNFIAVMMVQSDSNFVMLTLWLWQSVQFT